MDIEDLPWELLPSLLIEAGFPHRSKSANGMRLGSQQNLANGKEPNGPSPKKERHCHEP